MLMSSLCDYSDPHILKGTITVAQVVAPVTAVNNDKEVVYKNCASFSGYISE